jgi:outer membrane receptor protein involved in Fe transport
MKKFLLLSLIFSLFAIAATAQNVTIKGVVKSAETKDRITGATVELTPGNYRTKTGSEGDFIFKSVSGSNFTLTVNYIGFEPYTLTFNATDDFQVEVLLVSGGLSTEVIEINRAIVRETPVAFTDIDAKTIETRMQGQDAPLLLRNVPGFYSYSTDGVGNGEGKLLIRGFNQNYVQVLINGIPTNDPESNSVYWSNWGSVSSNAGSIQLQRGAGSSLYGSGAFGGSFNILTENPALSRYLGLKGNFGDPLNTMYGVNLSSGLISGKFAGALNVERKIAEGSRTSGRYDGLNYYLSAAFLPSTDQTFKLVLHGAPQSHGYSFSNDIAYFKKYGYTANSAPFVSRDVADQWDAKYGAQGDPTYQYRSITDGVRELVDDNFVNLSHNMFHKPQVELHWNYNLKDNSIIRATGFWTAGRGGGSSINSAGTMWSWKPGLGTNGFRTDTLLTNLYNSSGYLSDFGVFDTVYSKNAYQRNSYSIHNQTGILASYEKQFDFNLNLTAGAEFRYWNADHPGYFTNLFGKTSTTQRYAFYDTTGKLSNSTFSRLVTQGDIDGPDYDWGIDVFGWNSDGDPTYKSQYRNYLGETPQLTFFAQGNYILNKFNFMGSLQYVWYNYKITENMPSENAIGRKLSIAEAQSLGVSTEGAVGDKFYMKDNSATPRWYEFDLVREDRSRGFFQPKVGLNYNATKNINVFGNFAHVERFVDLGVYYNQGRINTAAEDEKSNQFELGVGWNSDALYAKLNGYYMLWDNKSASIQDQSQAGQPGYDRNGFRTELVGTSRHMGGEFEFGLSLNNFIKPQGFGFRGSFTLMENTWQSVLDNVKTDPVTGKRRPFNASALDMNGNRDTLYFDELEGTYVASGPQLMTSLSLTYQNYGFFGSFDMSFFAKDILLDGGTYTGIDGQYVGTDYKGRELFQTEFSDELPSRFLFDFNAGYNFSIGQKMPVRGTISLQVLNIFDSDYLASADRFGVIPGMKRAFRMNLGIGL